MIRHHLLPVILVAGLAAAACGGSDSSTSDAGTDEGAPAADTAGGADTGSLLAATTSEAVCDALDPDRILGAIAGGNGSTRPQVGVIACAISGQQANGAPVTVIVEIPRDGDGDGSFAAVETWWQNQIDASTPIPDVGDEAIVYTSGDRTKLLAGSGTGSIGISSDVTLADEDLADIARTLLG